MDEPSARRVILVRAIETADAEGKLVGLSERDEIDHAARREATAPTVDNAGRPFPAEQFLDLRARRVLAIVEARNPELAALQEPQSWQRWLGIGVPAAALVMGILTNFAVNPHRLDLVSLPLLGVIAWNVVVYLLLVLGWTLRGRPGGKPWVARLGSYGRFAMRRRLGIVRAQVTLAFHRHWFEATQQLHVQRSSRVLHTAAAAWAIGVILSLLMHGLVVQYKVGWESTFLGAEQVHRLLEFLRLPALLLFPMPPFTLQDVARLNFTQGGGSAEGGQPWALMYVALLLVVVVIPRLVLAAWAFMLERMLVSRVPVKLAEPYYQRIVSLLSSARVQLAVITHRDEDRAALMRVLVQEADITNTLASTDHGDVLRFVDLSGKQPPASSVETAPATAAWKKWFAGVLDGRRAESVPGDPLLAGAREETDVVLHVARSGDDIAESAPLVDWLGKPVLVLGDAGGGRERSLPFDHFARSWVQERVLFDAISGLLPTAKVPGFARLAKAWEERNQARFARSMGVVAEHLMFAAKQAEEVQGSALTVRSVLYSERESQANARQAAMDAIVQRIDASCAEMFARLRQLHGIEESAAAGLQHHLEQKFIVQQSVDTPQAGLAGAATGAAMGASVDLLTGGLTLGAAAALGAVIGGGAAFATAAWKNRATASGSTLVQLSDEMMQALVEAALLRYLAVAHYGRTPSDDAAQWRSEVVAAVEADKSLLMPFWTASRTQPHAARLASALSQQLEAIAMKVMLSRPAP